MSDLVSREQPAPSDPAARGRSGGEVVLSSIRKDYGSVTAVDDVSLTVKPGEFLTLLGSSGSGKSTILNMVAGFVWPSSGRITIDNSDLTNVPPHRRNIGMVFQDYALFPHMRVRDNIAFPLRQRKVSKTDIRRRVKEALSLVKLEGYEHRFPRELSGGQQQRIALARALVFRPSILLMDEPLGALDKNLREHLQLEIRRLHSDLGITFIFVTHDQDEALVMSDRIVVLRDGRVEQIGPPEELYNSPRTRYVAEFVGDANLVVGIVQGSDVGSTLRVGQHHLLGHMSSDAKAGTENVMVIRPDKIRLWPDVSAEPTGPGWNRLRGRVEEVVFLGGVRRFVVRLDFGMDFVVRQQEGGRGTDFRQGDSVGVGWVAEDAPIIPQGIGAERDL